MKFLHFCMDECNFLCFGLLLYIVRTNYFELRDTALEREYICDYYDILTELMTKFFIFGK